MSAIWALGWGPSGPLDRPSLVDRRTADHRKHPIALYIRHRGHHYPGFAADANRRRCIRRTALTVGTRAPTVEEPQYRRDNNKFTPAAIAGDAVLGARLWQARWIAPPTTTNVSYRRHRGSDTRRLAMMLIAPPRITRPPRRDRPGSHRTIAEHAPANTRRRRSVPGRIRVLQRFPRPLPAPSVAGGPSCRLRCGGDLEEFPRRRHVDVGQMAPPCSALRPASVARLREKVPSLRHHLAIERRSQRKSQ